MPVTRRARSQILGAAGLKLSGHKKLESPPPSQLLMAGELQSYGYEFLELLVSMRCVRLNRI